MTRSRRPTRVLALALLAAACGGGGAPVTDLGVVKAAMPKPAAKVVLVGLDGADWQVARPLMEAGRLPVLRSLVEEGASGELRSIEPMISPALWTTVVTGVLPEHHGIRDFVYKEPGSYAQPIVNSTIRERLALWNILSALGLTVGVVDWYATWPAETVNGFIVSDRIKTLEPSAAGVTYPDYAQLEPAFRELLPLPRLPAFERLVHTWEPLPEGLDKALKEDLYRFRLAKRLYQERRPDFFAFYLKGLDAVGHLYWHEHERSLAAAQSSMLTDYYELCDQLLGDFFSGLEADTTVLVVSDHGFRPFGRPDSLIFDLDRLFEALGWLEFEEPALAARRSERRVRMDRTRAYSHEGTMIVSAFGSRESPVYLNLAGRDPQGVIPAEEWPAVRTELKERLERLRTDLDTPVFSEVRESEAEARSGVQAPDLYLRVNREIAHDYELLIDGKPYSLFDTLFWEYGNISGTHRPQGILVARGPGIRRNVRIEGAGLVDVAPTILSLVGAPLPDDLDGRPLRAMLTAPETRAGLRVASYEGLIERRQARVDTTTIDEAYREKLRALGYVQ